MSYRGSTGESRPSAQRSARATPRSCDSSVRNLTCSRVPACYALLSAKLLEVRLSSDEWTTAERQFAKALQRRIFWRNLCDRLYTWLTGVDQNRLIKARMHRLGL